MPRRLFARRLDRVACDPPGRPRPRGPARGDPAEYAERYIPQRRLVTPADLSVSDRTDPGVTLELPRPENLRLRLAGLGISDRSRFVVYMGRRRNICT